MTAIQNQIAEELKRRYPDTEIQFNDVLKAGGVAHAITIIKKGTNTGINVYYESFRGEEVSTICDNVSRIYEKNFVGSINLDFVYDFTKVKDMLTMRLLHTERCAEYLADKPSKQLLDLSIIYAIDLTSEDLKGTSQMVINNSLLDLWKIDVDTLDEFARKNAEKSVDIIDLGCLTHQPPMGIAVISNKNHFYGAGVLPVALPILKKVFGKCYIIPSSVHEVMAFPCDLESFQQDDGFVSATINEINSTMLDEFDILSDHGYYFDGESLQGIA